jgi:hypothetical protein
MTSFVHDELAFQGHLGSFADNRPKSVRCVHPIVTLLEKLDALHRRVPNEKIEPASFVRHFEDAAKVIKAEPSLPPLIDYEDARALAADMLRERQIAAIRSAADPAFGLAPGPRADAVQAAYTAIDPMFWGPRTALSEACMAIREWIDRSLTADLM